jgi:protein associated with RNAse G/E
VIEVRVVYRKYDGTLHWNQAAIRLGEDEHGVWLGTPAGTPVYRGEMPSAPAASANVLLVPNAGWWTGCFNAEPHRTEVYCDVTTVPTWPSSAEVTMVDLDLDVRRRRTGAVELLDEGEFAEHRVRFDYPDDIVTGALAAAQWLLAAVRDRVEPFGAAYEPWLAKLA